MARLTIHQYEDFTEGAQASVARLYQEIAEVQEALNDAREATRMARREATQRARAMVAERRADLDPAFADAFDAAVAEALHSLNAEGVALKQLVADGEAKSQSLLEEARVVREELKALNPELDAQEEALKRDLAALESQAMQLDKDIERKARWFGMYLRKREIMDLADELKRVDERLEATGKALDEVRRRWNTELTAGHEMETGLQEQWKQNEIRVARLRQDLATLEADLQGEAETRALFGMVAGEKSAPATGIAEVDAQLEEVNRLCDLVDEQEEALTAGAEMLGMLSGLGQGLDGFRESVGSVRQEQDAHSELARLYVDVPPQVEGFHQTWDELAKYVVDEKQMAAYPGHFYRALRATLDERLTPATIEGVFTDMGNALSVATANWSA